MTCIPKRTKCEPNKDSTDVELPGDVGYVWKMEWCSLREVEDHEELKEWFVSVYGSRFLSDII